MEKIVKDLGMHMDHSVGGTLNFQSGYFENQNKRIHQEQGGKKGRDFLF